MALLRWPRQTVGFSPGATGAAKKLSTIYYEFCSCQRSIHGHCGPIASFLSKSGTQAKGPRRRGQQGLKKRCKSAWQPGLLRMRKGAFFCLFHIHSPARWPRAAFFPPSMKGICYASPHQNCRRHRGASHQPRRAGRRRCQSGLRRPANRPRGAIRRHGLRGHRSRSQRHQQGRRHQGRQAGAGALRRCLRPQAGRGRGQQGGQ